jgi:hypothetical protein
MYKEGVMENNRTIYNLSISDISDSIYDMLQDNRNEKPLIDPEYDPNKSVTIDSSKLDNTYQNGISAMIKKQYMYDEQMISYTGNPFHYDYHNSSLPHIYYNTGYRQEAVKDNSGIFYIVHPDELLFNRNILGEIISTTTDSEQFGLQMIDSKKIKSDKIISFFNILLEKIFLINDNHDFTKTEYGRKIKEVHKKIAITDGSDIRGTISYLYSRKYSLDGEFIKLIPMIEMMSMGSLADIIDKTSDNKVKIDNIKNIYDNCFGDSNGIINIINRFLAFIDANVTNFTKAYDGLTQLSERKSLAIQKRMYIEGKQSKNFRGISDNLLDKFIEIDNKGDLTNSLDISSSEFNKYYTNDLPVTNISDALSKNEDNIARWCRQNYLDYRGMIRYLKSYSKYLNNIYKLQQDLFEKDYDKDTDTELLKWFDNKLIVNTPKTDNLGLPLLHGYSSNIVRRIEGSKMYVPIVSPAPEYICTIKTIHPKSPIRETMLKDTCMREYLLYLNKRDDEISLIHNIDAKTIQSIVPFTYAPERYLPENYNIGTYKKAIDHLVSLFNVDITDKEVKHKKLRHNMVNDYMKTVSKIRVDMLNNYNPNVWYTVKKLDPSSTHIELIEKQIRYQHNIKRNMPNVKMQVIIKN